MVADFLQVVSQLESLPIWCQALAVGIALSIVVYGAYGNIKLLARGTAGAAHLSAAGIGKLLAWYWAPSRATLERLHQQARVDALDQGQRFVHAELVKQGQRLELLLDELKPTPPPAPRKT